MGANKAIIQRLLQKAGVEIDGPNRWDIRVLNEGFYQRVAARGSLGLGEAYMDGWWECDRVDEFIERVLRAGLDESAGCGLAARLARLPAGLLNSFSRRGFSKLTETHYDLSRELFMSFLDRYNQYSCGFFEDTDDLDEAQQNKMEMICRKIGIGRGDRVLDIGCGWGGLSRYMAETRGCDVVAVNISDEQIAYAREFCAGLPVEVRKQDYRDLDEEFDKIVSVGMFEHVGPRGHRAFFEAVRRCLADDGACLVQTIGGNRASGDCDPWIKKYIFPQGALPGVGQIGESIEGLLVMEDWHNMGPHYDRTLMAWHDNFARARPRLKKSLGLDERFGRMWEYYLLSCAGAFRSRSIQLWQVAFTPVGAAQPEAAARRSPNRELADPRRAEVRDTPQ
jgi:cyclopropane-fatty-acyl-phospholipid synthase